MAYNINLGTFKAVEVNQQGQIQLKFIPTSLVVDVSEIEAVYPYWNSVEGLWDTTRTVSTLKSGISLNINQTYSAMQDLLVPSTPPAEDPANEPEQPGNYSPQQG